MDKNTIVIIGGGIAGLTAAEEIRKNSREAEITIISGEKKLPYYRLNLTRFLGGEVNRDSLNIHPMPWYEEKGIKLVIGKKAVEIDKENSTILLDDGTAIKYGRLIITTGANPRVPPFLGNTLKNVMTIRKVEDVEDILDILPSIKTCVCIGGGIIGIEAASAVAKRGVKVALVENMERLMPMQLNKKAAAMLKKSLHDMGIEVWENARVKEIEGQEACRRVMLESGESINSDMVIISAGVSPETSLAKNAGLKVERGLVVNDKLQTSYENIYAAGDVAEHRGVVYGLWSVAQIQGRVAGSSALGLDTSFEGIPKTNIVKVVGIDIFSIGEFIPGDEEAIELEKETPKGYMSIVLREGRIVGCNMIGDMENKTLPVKIKQAVEKAMVFSEEAVRSVDSITEKLLK